MINNDMIFHNKDMIEKLTYKYYKKDLNCTGAKIISGYSFDIKEFEDSFNEKLFFTDYYFITCSEKTKKILDKKFKFEEDYISKVTDDSYDLQYLIKREYNLSLISIINKIYELNLSEAIELSTDYYSFFLLHINICNNKIENMVYDPIPNGVDNEDDTSDDILIGEEDHERFILHTIYKLSFNEPINDLLNLLNIK